MASSPKRLPPLGELEQSVLEHLWRTGESDVAEVHAALGTSSSPNTVGSALERLHRKGLAARRKVSHAYRYRAALARDEFAAQRVVEAAGGAKALARAGLLAAFVDLVADVDEAALDRLAALIAERRERRRKA